MEYCLVYPYPKSSTFLTTGVGGAESVECLPGSCCCPLSAVRLLAFVRRRPKISRASAK